MNFYNCYLHNAKEQLNPLILFPKIPRDCHGISLENFKQINKIIVCPPKKGKLAYERHCVRSLKPAASVGFVQMGISRG